MNTIRSCFAFTVAFLVVAIGWSATDAVVCCNSSTSPLKIISLISSCSNQRRQFHTIEVLGGDTCDDNRTAVPVRKCCPPGQPYDPEVRLCGPAGAEGDKYLRPMMQRLRNGSRVVAESVKVGYYFRTPKCNATQVLVDVPAAEVSVLLEGGPSLDKLPPDYCFDLTPSYELVAQTCRPRDQYCGRNGYTCVNKCCGGDYMMVFDNEGKMNYQTSNMSFMMSTYETDSKGRPTKQSNNTVLKYHDKVSCPDGEDMYETEEFKVATNGSLYYYEKLLKGADYCVEYIKFGIQPTRLIAIVCVDANKPPAAMAKDNEPPAIANSTKPPAMAKDNEPPAIANSTKPPAMAKSNESPAMAKSNKSPAMTNIKKPPAMAKDTRGSLFCCVVSAVCLALTLIVYRLLPSLQNIRNSYVKWYVFNLLMSFICLMAQGNTENMKGTLCVVYGYVTLFILLTTCCWLNVICFDIYWMLSDNNSVYRNTSISVRTIIYHIYCWGLPSIFVSTGYLFQNSGDKTLMKFAPDIGQSVCWFKRLNGNGGLIFFLIPVSAMLTMNLIFFFLTSIYCLRIKSEIHKFKRTDSKTELFCVYKEKFLMNIKLFLVMGILYCPLIFSFFFRINKKILNFFDAVANLQGVFVFIVFVAKPKVIMELRKKIKGSMDHRESTQINTITVSS